MRKMESPFPEKKSARYSCDEYQNEWGDIAPTLHCQNQTECNVPA
jgi:hypothetical protein